MYCEENGLGANEAVLAQFCNRIASDVFINGNIPDFGQNRISSALVGYNYIS